MKTPERRLWISIQAGILLFLMLIGSFLGKDSYTAHAASTNTVRAASTDGQLTYYGVDLKKMAQATGVNPAQPNTIAPNAPWPQYASNYCFTAVVQAIVNYNDLTHGLPMRYPHQSDEGPLSGDPGDEVAGQILYDMDNFMIPQGGPLSTVSSGTTRRPYTLANIAYDFGGDPRSQAAGTDYEMRHAGFPYIDTLYHQHIYHNGAAAATMGIAKALAQFSEPVIALVNHAEHSVLVTGVWMTGNPLVNPNAQIVKLDVFNPWDESWGTYLSTGNYAHVSYDDWINATNLPAPWGGVNSWYNLPYSSNGILDPDPSIGIYQAGAGTQNPDATHWIGNFVFIQYDGIPVSPDLTFNENNHIMLKP